MKTIAFLLTCISLAASGQAQNQQYSEIRKLYFEKLNVEGGASVLIAEINRKGLEREPLGMAYLGAAYAASAGEQSMPLAKLRKFNQGKQLLESAVSMSAVNVEIRFLRLATQIMSPSFLGYKDDIENDKKLILQTFYLVGPNHPNSYFYRHICTFMLVNLSMTNEERQKVQDLQLKLSKK